MRTVIVTVVLALMVLAIPVPAQAHGQLAFSVPAHQTTVNTPLDRIELHFTEQLSANAKISATAPDGTSVLSGWTQGTPRPLASPVQEYNLAGGEWKPVSYSTGFPAVLTMTHWPARGVYTIHYEAIATDGDQVRGDIRFDYQGPLTSSPNGIPVWVWWVSGLTVLIGLAAWRVLVVSSINRQLSAE